MVTLSDRYEAWDKCLLVGHRDLEILRDEINAVLSSQTTAEKLNVTEEQGKIMDQHHKEDPMCKGCEYKLSQSCRVCLFTLQSPLERKLYLELKKNHIRFDVQHGLNWAGETISIEGKSYGNEKNNFKEVLTVVDFHITKKDTKLCVYTDGHTYHERTEEQAQRDRNIDRKLQELDFNVLRYTGKEVNENMSKIISDIKKWIT
ncbi:DUF559 domain-containing protein [Flavobacterium sp. RSB2_4_14]|uniref:DUF559 domain-containing protein n=1 Tax=Flavobacterium sp. RSB2_4_14 TaxID=3447665 RepID=UPI003F400FD6